MSSSSSKEGDRVELDNELTLVVWFGSAQTVSMIYNKSEEERYLLNLIDTP